MIQRKGTVVGTDAFFREIAVGDEIRDIEGRLYTIDQFGRAKPLDGGNSVPLRNVKEPAVVRDYAGPDLLEAAKTEVQKAKAEPATAEPATPDPGTPSGEPSETAGQTPGEISQSPDKPRARGHRPNKTGFIRLTNLGVPFGLTCVEVREILEGAGIEIVPCGRKKESSIRKDDAPAAQRALDAWAERHSAPAETPPPSPGTLAGFSDQHLANELRRRGYDVTAVKHVEL